MTEKKYPVACHWCGAPTYLVETDVVMRDPSDSPHECFGDLRKALREAFIEFITGPGLILWILAGVWWIADCVGNTW